MMTIEANNTVMSSLSEQAYIIRAMFYLLTPNETFYKEVDEVPNLKVMTGNTFIGFILIEQLICLFKYGKFNGRLSDMITSISAGMIYGLPEILSRQISMVTYEWVYDNYCIFELPWNSNWTYLIIFLLYDMLFYWFHRASHEMNLFWASHQTHHSSEDYNLSTALRQSVFSRYLIWVFFLPLGLFIRPSIYLIHTHLNLIYQFWIHTEVVDNLGPLEYILNTASHHRVHHGRNPYCIDKNYAGVLIIWDRIFGTFAAEKKDEELAYGLVHPIETFDPIYIQAAHFQYMIGKFISTESWSDKFSVLFKGPGWMPGTPRLGNKEDLPKIQYPIVKKGAPMSSLLNIYVIVHFIFTIIFFGEYVKTFQEYTTISLSIFIMLSLYSLTCFGKFFDHCKSAVYFDFLRCVFLLVLCFHAKFIMKKLLRGSEEVFQIYFYINIFSLLVMAFLSYQNMFINKTSHAKIDENNNEIIPNEKITKFE